MEESDLILLDAGSGGAASQRLIKDIFLRHFANDILATMDDAALLTLGTNKIAVSTDSYTVSPLFFPGANIGSLAINGTVNDVAMLGARPRFLTTGFIIEEGFSLSALEKIVSGMATAAKKAGVSIVTGDTKVVPVGACDKIFINTTGIGEIFAEPATSGHNAQVGDAIIISGTIGDHGLAVLAARNEFPFLSGINSDCAPLGGMVADLLASVPCIHTLRDPTRGGLATTLNEIAEQSHVCVEIEEERIPVNGKVDEGCAVLGLDPLYLANEGKLICIVPSGSAHMALDIIKRSPYGANAAIIGKITDRKPGKVIYHTRIGGERYLGMLEGAQLPRIC